jgi:sodium-dependent dicarboxylate transporter 2/3/5
MSNTATSSVLIPLGIALPGSLELSAPLVIAISPSCALFLPVSTPPNAIAYSTGYISQKDFRLGGIAMGIIGPIIAVFAMILFSWIY